MHKFDETRLVSVQAAKSTHTSDNLNGKLYGEASLECTDIINLLGNPYITYDLLNTQ